MKSPQNQSKEVIKKFHSYQMRVLKSQKRWILALAGVQSGKTTVGAAMLAQWVSEKPKEDYLIACPTYKMLQSATLRKFFSEFPQFRQFYNSADSVIKLPTGGNIYIRSTENPVTIEGMTVAGAWLDEAGLMPDEAWLYVQARLAVKRGRCVMTTTPYSMSNWVYTDIWEKWRNGDTDIDVFTWSSEQNPYFPKEEYERVKASLDPLTFDQRYRAIFTRRMGLVYNLKSDMVVDEVPDEYDTVLGGIDWGWNAPSVLLVCGIDRERRYWLKEEWYERGKTAEEVIAKALHLQNKHKVNVWYADPSRGDTIESAKRAGLYIRDAENDIKAGVDTLRNIIVSNRFRMHRSCKNTRIEFENYAYPSPDEANYVKDLPKKGEGFDHSMDALRYLAHSHLPTPIADLQQQRRMQQARRISRSME